MSFRATGMNNMRTLVSMQLRDCESGHDEPVEVNQRALIDKVLARYPGEFSVFRELLQNSDDANAKTVEIHFETEAFLQRQDAKGPEDPNGDGAASKPGTETLPDLKTAVIHQWTFKNDGIIFRDEDWGRWKKIAEGNPEQDNIGAFGVGSKSLFSVTEEPFVASGGQWMCFYWKDDGNQLFIRRGVIREDQRSVWTTFCMLLREPGPVPPLFDFIRFLASSITFMARLSEVSVFFDGKRIAKLDKIRGIPRPIGLRNGLKSQTQKGTMRVTDISVTPLSIEAEVMQWVSSVGSFVTSHKRANTQQLEASEAVSSEFFASLPSGSVSPRTVLAVQPIQSKEENKHEEDDENAKLWNMLKTSVVLDVFSADVAVTLTDCIRDGLLRTTKKHPPSKMKYELIYTGREIHDSSSSLKGDAEIPLTAGSIFQGLRADVDGARSARIFIGHSTSQTTGIGGHMSARFIPTVERESIDFVDRNVRLWNEELLGVGAYLARSAYEEEMDNISSIWDATAGKTDSEPTEEHLKVRKNLQARALYALKFFTFHASTPSPRVAKVLKEGFFSCAQASLSSCGSGGDSSCPFPIMSTVGIRDAADVRFPNKTLKAFLKKLPMLSQEFTDGAGTMINTLRQRSRKWIRNIQFLDVLTELKDRPLSEEEIIACIKWWIGKIKGGANPLESEQRELLTAAVLILGTPGSADEKHIPIASIETILDSRDAGVHIPADGPLPLTLLPLTISQHFDHTSLCSSFGWKEFTVIEWLKHILESELRVRDTEHDVTRSAVWAERVLTSLSRAWPSLAKNTTSTQQEVVELLCDLPCIPTSAGLKRPAEAYFQNAHVFPDMPLVKFSSEIAIQGPLEDVLEILGVRRHVELQLVFDRMTKTREWSTHDVVKYLVIVRRTLSTEEMERLRMMTAFPKELEKAPQDNKGDGQRFRANQLYEPLAQFRELGLPLIDWGVENNWRSDSEEAKFLILLGLLRNPPLDTVINLAAGPDEHVRYLALRYLLHNRTAKYNTYNHQAYAHVAFIPANKNGRPALCRPGEVFVDEKWAIMQFNVTSDTLTPGDFRNLGVEDSPPPEALVKLLTNNPPGNEKLAQQWFALLAGRIADFTDYDFQTLSTLPIIPIKQLGDASGQSAYRMMAPDQCFFLSASSTQDSEVYSRLFTFIDFESPANQFLRACGTKNKPTLDDIARIMVEHPGEFCQPSQPESRDSYLKELRKLAAGRYQLSTGTLASMKGASIFLGSRRAKTEMAEESAEAEDGDAWKDEWCLLTPENIVIADDTNAEYLFGDAVFSCPPEDLLEGFYHEMGSRLLTSLIEQERQPETELQNTQKAMDLRESILGRLPLFLHEHTQTSQVHSVPYSWLKQDENFVVRTVENITVEKVLTYNGTRIVKTQDRSVAAFRDGSGPIVLYLLRNRDADMYEVSTSMCKLLLERPRASDALLFMTILSTDLNTLQRRGYNVGRILQRQQARQAAQAPKPSDDQHHGELASTNTTPCMPGAFPDTHDNVQTSWFFTGIFGQNRSWWARPNSAPSAPTTPSACGITSRQTISDNVQTAIDALKEGRESVLKSWDVKESSNHKYCGNDSAVDRVLARMVGGKPSGNVGVFKVFMNPDITQPEAAMLQKQDSINQFIRILQPLAKVYKVPPSRFCIFFDNAGDTIAFNLKGSLYCNLRFFEEWHAEQVKADKLSEAFISWYFTLAHEIAHNLAPLHDAKHEFWFSSLCEKYIPALSSLLASHK